MGIIGFSKHVHSWIFQGCPPIVGFSKNGHVWIFQRWHSWIFQGWVRPGIWGCLRSGELAGKQVRLGRVFHRAVAGWLFQGGGAFLFAGEPVEGRVVDRVALRGITPGQAELPASYETLGFESAEVAPERVVLQKTSRPISGESHCARVRRAQ